VNFSAVPIFYKKIRIARAGKIFWPQKNPEFIFRAGKKGPYPVGPGPVTFPNREIPARPESVEDTKGAP
jgi:hypothetical protein